MCQSGHVYLKRVAPAGQSVVAAEQQASHPWEAVGLIPARASAQVTWVKPLCVAFLLPQAHAGTKPGTAAHGRAGTLRLLGPSSRCSTLQLLLPWSFLIVY